MSKLQLSPYSDKALNQLASILGRKDVNIRYSDCATASTDGETINLPSACMSSPEAMEAVQGYIDHETGHVRWSSFSLAGEFRAKGPSWGNLLNILEDVRIEQLAIKAYPGMFFNLNNLTEYMKDNGLYQKPSRMAQLVNAKASQATKIISAIEAFILYHLGSKILQYKLQEHAETSRKFAVRLMGEKIVSDVAGFAEKIKYAKSTQDAADITTKIMEYLKQSCEPDNQNQSGTGAGDDQSGESSQDNGNQGQSGDGDDSNTNQPSESGQDSGDQEQSGSDQSSQGDQQQAGSNDDNTGDDNTDDSSNDPEKEDNQQQSGKDNGNEDSAQDSAEADEGADSNGNSQQSQPSDQDKDDAGSSNNGKGHNDNDQQQSDQDTGKGAGGQDSNNNQSQPDQKNSGNNQSGSDDNQSNADSGLDFDNIREQDIKVKSRGDVLADHLKEKSKEVQSQQTERAERGCRRSIPQMPDYYPHHRGGETLLTPQINQLANTLKSQLISVMRSAALTREASKRQGSRVNTRSVYRAVTSPNPRIFKHKTFKQDVNANIVVLVDRSGSTKGMHYDMNENALIITKAFSSTNGIDIHVASFDSRIEVLYDGRTDDFSGFYPAHRGSTCTDMATMHAISALRKMPQKDKNIVFIVTDGQPDTIASAVTGYQMLKQLGCEVYGIYVSDCESRYEMAQLAKYVDRFAYIPEPKDLPRQMLRMFRNSSNLLNKQVA